ncbi:MAG: glycosyl hydrolase family 32 [Acidobacteriota bacterium]
MNSDERLVITRRDFIRAAAGALAPLSVSFDVLAQGSETLYNGIRLPTPWPPRRRVPDPYPVTPPYLSDPPEVIPIDLGRQLFVDDFLIEETTLWRRCHHAVYHAGNPVLKPERPWELRDEYSDRTGRRPNPTAMPFSDGVFFDPADGLFKLWYMGGYLMHTCLAVSDDGLAWRRPAFDVIEGTNIVMRSGRDSGTVWLDQSATDPRQRFKMALFHEKTLSLHVSPDGIHWTSIGETGLAGDRTTFFYNPYRKVWVFGVRADLVPGRGRYRRYWEHAQFASAHGWNASAPVAWVRADALDIAWPGFAAAAELYNLDCVAYESVLLGMFNVWRGEFAQREKINELTVGFSRDGFHWSRPDRRTFLGVSEASGSWNWANVQSAGGACLVVGDTLRFYVSGRQGVPGTDEPGVCSTGVAMLRRDGFASMDWLPDEVPVVRRGLRRDLGTLVTRPVVFSGGHLFVNAETRDGELRVEVLDRQGRVLPSFTFDECVPVRGNGTKLPVSWSSGASLASLARQTVRFRFSLTKGSLYAFWVSRWPTGESGGYVAAGGPGFKSSQDLP